MNVAALRSQRGLSVRELSRRLGVLGRPILPSGITKLEQGRRGVDTDDLVALALALDATPNRLLLTPGAGEEPVALTARVQVRASSAWKWASGDDCLDDPFGAPGIDLGREKRFAQENRPHDPPSTWTFDQVIEHLPALTPVLQAVSAAEAAGVPPAEVDGFLRLARAGGTFLQSMRTQRGGT